MEEDIDIITIIKNLHKIIGSNILKSVRKYKQHENHLLNSNGDEINFTKVNDADLRMNELKENSYGKWMDLTVFERSEMIHMSIINIHPFN